MESHGGNAKCIETSQSISILTIICIRFKAFFYHITLVLHKKPFVHKYQLDEIGSIQWERRQVAPFEGVIYGLFRHTWNAVDCHPLITLAYPWCVHVFLP